MNTILRVTTGSSLQTKDTKVTNKVELVSLACEDATGCGFESPASQLKNTNCLSDETLNRGRV